MKETKAKKVFRTITNIIIVLFLCAAITASLGPWGVPVVTATLIGVGLLIRFLNWLY
jgi:fatty acid desaturase